MTVTGQHAAAQTAREQRAQRHQGWRYRLQRWLAEILAR
jgi:hypothetical protein